MRRDSSFHFKKQGDVYLTLNRKSARLVILTGSKVNGVGRCFGGDAKLILPGMKRGVWYEKPNYSSQSSTMVGTNFTEYDVNRVVIRY